MEKREVIVKSALRELLRKKEKEIKDFDSMERGTGGGIDLHNSIPKFVNIYMRG